MTNPIADAVNPMREQAAMRQVIAAMRYIERLQRRFEAAGCDLEIVAPMPHGRMSKAEYQQAAALRGKYQALTERVDAAPSHRFGAPDVRRFVPVRVTGWLAQVERDAHADFDAYVAKLTGKVGPCVAATIVGYVWNGSVLTVTKEDGTTQRWHTQQIVNVSVLGKLFNQWPTRKLKT